MGQEKTKKINTGRFLKIPAEFSREIPLAVLSIQSPSRTSETPICAHHEPWPMQTALNKAGGFIVESRGNIRIWKAIRPKSCCCVPVFVRFMEAKADNLGLLHHSKRFGKQSTLCSCYNHFISFAESKQQISRYKQTIFCIKLQVVLDV